MKTLRAAVMLLVTGFATAAPAIAQDRPSWPDWVDFSTWTNVSEDYRLQFARCDSGDEFRDYKLKRKIGKRFYYGCSTDRNRVSVLRKLPSSDGLPRGAVAFTSKLGVDLDGSWYACNTPGQTDQCPTSLMLRDSGGQRVPTSSDHIAYVVIPVAGPTTAAGSGMSRVPANASR